MTSGRGSAARAESAQTRKWRRKKKKSDSYFNRGPPTSRTVSRNIGSRKTTAGQPSPQTPPSAEAFLPEKAAQKRKAASTTEDAHRGAAKHQKRDYTDRAPNPVHCGDYIYPSTRNAFYISLVLGLCARVLFSGSLSHHIRGEILKHTQSLGLSPRGNPAGL